FNSANESLSSASSAADAKKIPCAGAQGIVFEHGLLPVSSLEVETGVDDEASHSVSNKTRNQTCDLSEISARTTRSVVDVRLRIRKVRMIQNIDRVEPEFESAAF